MKHSPKLNGGTVAVDDHFGKDVGGPIVFLLLGEERGDGVGVGVAVCISIRIMLSLVNAVDCSAATTPVTFLLFLAGFASWGWPELISTDESDSLINSRKMRVANQHVKIRFRLILPHRIYQTKYLHFNTWSQTSDVTLAIIIWDIQNSEVRLLSFKVFLLSLRVKIQESLNSFQFKFVPSEFFSQISAQM